MNNLGRVLKEEWNSEDLRDLTFQLKEQESLIRLKRRWLMDLPLTVREQERVNEILPPDDVVLAESLIREDDLSYERIKTRIEKGFEAHKCEKELYSDQEDAEVFNSRDVLFHLDDLTNKGLYSLTEILTSGIIKFEKTNLRMNMTIKELLRKNDISKTQLKLVSRLLKDPKNFRGNHSACSTPSEVYRAAVVSVLDKLEDFSEEALQAMQRRLTCFNGYTPSLVRRTRNQPSKKDLVHNVKKIFKEKLSELSKANNEPAEELSRALGVAGISLKLILNHTDVIDFCRFPPEIECLQNDIAKAILLVKNPKKLRPVDLKKVQLLLDPESNISNNYLRRMVANLLAEYLYECSDMDRVPDYLLDTVEFINRRSQVPSCKKEIYPKALLFPHDLMKEVIQKEVEHVLTVSAQAKGVILDLLPQHEFDEDFAHAYMEDFVDEQVWDNYENHELDSCDSCDQREIMGQNMLVNTVLPSPGIAQKCVSSDGPLEQTNIVTGENGSGGNQYLEVQEACDATTMVAYHFVGHVLDKFAEIEGLELSQSDRLYLRGHSSSVPEDSEEPPNKLLTTEFSVQMWKNVIRGQM